MANTDSISLTPTQGGGQGLQRAEIVRWLKSYPDWFAAEKSAADGDRSFRAALPEGKRDLIGSFLFEGFAKCLCPVQKFHSEPERRFAVLLEDDADVLKWFRPAKSDIRIYHSRDEAYLPDFVVETKTEKLLCEVKRESEMEDAEVLAKANAAVVWCTYATAHAGEHGGKPWRYLRIPHGEVQAQMTLAGLAARYAVDWEGE